MSKPCEVFPTGDTSFSPSCQQNKDAIYCGQAVHRQVNDKGGMHIGPDIWRLCPPETDGAGDLPPGAGRAAGPVSRVYEQY